MPTAQLRSVDFSTRTALADAMKIPSAPVPCPSRARPRKVTTSVVAALIVMPSPLAATTPALPAAQEMVIAFVMFSGPKPPGWKPPGSRQLISPPAVVFARAAAKVLHGAVRLQLGLKSSPVPDTQVRAACACAGEAASKGNAR